MEAMTLERAQARANEIEDAICRGKMDVYQVFTQMRQLIPSARLAQPAQAVDVGEVTATDFATAMRNCGLSLATYATVDREARRLAKQRALLPASPAPDKEG